MFIIIMFMIIMNIINLVWGENYFLFFRGENVKKCSGGDFFFYFNGMDSKTIVAPMTPAGVSAVAALRVSGPAVRDVVRALFGEKALEKLKAREACLGTARDPRASASGKCADFASAPIIDSLLYIFFEGPNSYTGEDVLELYPHGNPLIVRELLQAIRSIEGVRLAEPGEYTRRAFLNGKMDLAQAESVADVIHSANLAELKNAHRLLSGSLSKRVAVLTEQIKDISARLELDVDFAEEEADPDYAAWGEKIAAIRENVECLLKSFRGSAGIRRLPLAVLYGAPNAGKSSLANALLGENRILVSDIPGTTRDFVEVRLFLEGGEIRLVDTAGIAERACDELDALSMEKSREILAEADLKILVVDGSVESNLAMLPSRSGNSSCNPGTVEMPDSSDALEAAAVAESEACEAPYDSRMVPNTIEKKDSVESDAFEHENSLPVPLNDLESYGVKPDLIVCSKSDLMGVDLDFELRPMPLEVDSSECFVSAMTGEGLSALAHAMNERLFADNGETEDFWITSEREKACLEDALAGIDRALELIRSNPAVELLAFEMQLVRRSLQSIVGEISSEDILQSIFAGFCIGK